MFLKLLKLSHPFQAQLYRTELKASEKKAWVFCGASLPPQFRQSVQSEHRSDLNRLGQTSEQSEQPEQVCSVKTKKHSDKRKHMVRAKYVSQSSSSEESESSVQVKKSSKPKRAPSDQDKQIQNQFLKGT